MAMNNPSQEKMHYDSLISLFKYVIGATTLLAGVVVFMIGSSLTEIKKTISDDVKESAKKLESVKSDADKTVADTKADANKVLQYTKEVTAMQINLLKDNAEILARNKVEEAFKNNNVQLMIDQTARKEVGDNLKRIVKEETDKTREIFSYMSRIQILYGKIGTEEDVAALHELDSLSNYCDNESIKKLSKEFLIQRGKDFDDRYKFYPSLTTTVAGSEEDFMQRLGLSPTSTTNEIVRKLVYEIKQRPHFGLLTRYYLLLKRKTGIDFKTFDSKPVYDWYNLNYRNN